VIPSYREREKEAEHDRYNTGKRSSNRVPRGQPIGHKPGAESELAQTPVLISVTTTIANRSFGTSRDLFALYEQGLFRV
jgi:hypothetical protein